jgi:transposase
LSPRVRLRARRGDRVKLLVWDATGLVLIWKRLESGRFKCKWPAVSDGVIRLSAAHLALLLEGQAGLVAHHGAPSDPAAARAIDVGVAPPSTDVATHLKTAVCSGR